MILPKPLGLLTTFCTKSTIKKIRNDSAIRRILTNLPLVQNEFPIRNSLGYFCGELIPPGYGVEAGGGGGH